MLDGGVAFSSDKLTWKIVHVQLASSLELQLSHKSAVCWSKSDPTFNYSKQEPNSGWWFSICHIYFIYFLCPTVSPKAMLIPQSQALLGCPRAIRHGSERNGETKDLVWDSPTSKMFYLMVNVYEKLWKDPPFWMGKSKISMAIFNSFFVCLPEGKHPPQHRMVNTRPMASPNWVAFVAKFWRRRMMGFL